jgi:hypothetical protein
VNYTRLSLPDVTTGLYDVARDAHATFGALDARQLNWQPDATRWSIAQCFEHLLRADGLMLQGADHALANPPRSIWQRLPLLPALSGRVMIRSLSPGTRRKRIAPARARPSASAIPGDVVERFVSQHRDAAEWTRALDQREASRAVMVSPFIRVITYSVLDGLRIVLAHDRRHLEQASRVMRTPGFAST